MGKLIYDSTISAEFTDRALHHLQVVITAKLRRGEPFNFTWREDPSIGGGRTTVWIHGGSDVVFEYPEGKQSAMNRAWVDALAFTANAPTGLYLVHEPDVSTSPQGTPSF